MTFETTLEMLIGKQPHNYHLNDNVRALLKLKHEYYGGEEFLKLFSWFRNVNIFIEENKVTIETPGKFHRDKIKEIYGNMLSELYKREIEIK